MAKGLNGMNKRVKETVEAETYLTPPWAVSWLLDRWTPSGSVICDPCACGFGGWSIGGQVVDTLNMRQGKDGVWSVELYDLTPRHVNVRPADFRELTLPEIVGTRTIITNPPYNLLPAFVRWAVTQPSVVEVVVLTRFGFLCAEQGRRAENLFAYYQPAKRLAFELLPEEGLRRVTHNEVLLARLEAGEITQAEYKKNLLDVHEDPRCLTGYRMSSTGVDHGWAVYQRGYTGKKELVIESAETEEGEEGPSKRLAHALTSQESRRRARHNASVARGEVDGKLLDVHETEEVEEGPLW